MSQRISTLDRSMFTPGGPTQPGLPDGCVGSYPNVSACRLLNWYTDEEDPCRPDVVPIPSQTVHIVDELNFCINLPDTDSIFLQNNFYNQGRYPRFFEGEGFNRAHCIGNPLPPGAKRMPEGALRSAHVLRNYTVNGRRYMQVHGYLDCEALKFNCTMSAPEAYDDGGQSDNAPFRSCGKSPYSGVYTQAMGSATFGQYVQQTGNNIFCMRVCEGDESGLSEGPCSVLNDTVGCEGTMGMRFGPITEELFTFQDVAGGPTRTTTLSLPPLITTGSANGRYSKNDGGSGGSTDGDGDGDGTGTSGSSSGTKSEGQGSGAVAMATVGILSIVGSIFALL